MTSAATDPSATATFVIDGELRCKTAAAQLVRFDMPAPTNSSFVDPGHYLVDMCLTPRPLNARGCYRQRWGPHRFERLGDIFVVPPGEELLFRGSSGQQAALRCQLDRRAIDTLVGCELAWTDKRLSTTVDLTSGQFKSLLVRLAEEVRHPGLAAGRMFEFLVGALSIELARLCLEENERPATGGLAGWRLRLIDERLSDDPALPTLGALAEMCNMSARQLSRSFRVSRGCSIGQYVQQRRMEMAKRLLVAGEKVKTIAFMMGYSSASSFTFAFRRAIGVSPSQFCQRQARGLRSY